MTRLSATGLSCLLGSVIAAAASSCGGDDSRGTVAEAPALRSGDVVASADDAPITLPKPFELVARERIPRLIEGLSDPDAAVRFAAARSLRMIEREPWEQMAFVDGLLVDEGPDPAAAIPALVRALRDSSEDVRLEAASVLGRFGRLGACAATELVRMLREEKSLRVRAAAGIALGKIGPSIPDAPLALAAALREEGAHQYLIEIAALSLGRIQEGAEIAVPDLVRFLTSDARAGVRRFAAMGLGKMGPNGAAAVPALVAALTDDSPDVRDMAALALGRIRDRAAVPALARALAFDVSVQVRRRAARALGFLGEASEAAIPELGRAVLEDADCRREAAWALGRIGPKALPALSELSVAASGAETAETAETMEAMLRATKAASGGD